MRQFSAEYLETTRRGMWADSREALSDLELPSRGRVLDVGCGTGELTRVLREETPGTVVGCDADAGLLAHLEPPTVVGDATRLPFKDDGFDLVVCQALLINLPDPDAGIEELARVSTDLVAAVEPDNGAVTVESTVDAESSLARRAREQYLDGVGTDVTLGADVLDRFEAAGLEDIRIRRYDHVRTVEPPYSEQALEDARRKVTGDGLADSRAELVAGDGLETYERLREEWRSMGRSVVEQMRQREYRRRETVPFYVTVGRVPESR
ncbi:class I SAM-dependent methyltransferase [Halapricum hydrolyticum]|uniref:Class I SAM-dependent methyltransferase n=1 Tax=Halapricum hydrolyticum TaxID=2979991 RepID=A0AAE3IEF1_9EURY|nr:class I SAM-dependent methyltransferase [Halapricum hydrolyticum]MCU4718829.1 class I SAM-dependent methyltransferase [Halapricum hydrolyticum]MCU4727763.1 class I SAM-dependent methyltransferase [Halapricum hydrolyticum]